MAETLSDAIVLYSALDEQHNAVFSIQKAEAGDFILAIFRWFLNCSETLSTYETHMFELADKSARLWISWSRNVYRFNVHANVRVVRQIMKNPNTCNRYKGSQDERNAQR